MKILALEIEVAGITADAFTTALKEAEARRAWGLYRAGAIRQLHFRCDQPLAVLELECASLAEARALVDTLPLVQAGLIAFDLIALAPYPGFERLFKQDSESPL
jgi:hypothetical protein